MEDDDLSHIQNRVAELDAIIDVIKETDPTAMQARDHHFLVALTEERDNLMAGIKTHLGSKEYHSSLGEFLSIHVSSKCNLFGCAKGLLNTAFHSTTHPCGLL
jgi:hypothetical protein